MVFFHLLPFQQQLLIKEVGLLGFTTRNKLLVQTSKLNYIFTFLCEKMRISQAQLACIVSLCTRKNKSRQARQNTTQKPSIESNLPRLYGQTQE
jgi:hypothetical protein